MPKFIVKLSELGERPYFMWSTVVDAPVSNTMTMSELQSFMRQQGWEDQHLSNALQTLEATGVSSPFYRNVDEVIKFNRAGKNETLASRDEIAKIVL